MGFVDLTAPPPKALAKSIKLSAQERKNGRIIVRMSIAVSILECIGKPTDEYVVGVGTGDDCGWLRLTKRKGGEFKPRILSSHKSGGGTAVFYLGETKFSPDGSQKGTECLFEQAATAINIKLPKWCFLDDLKEAA